MAGFDRTQLSVSISQVNTARAFRNTASASVATGYGPAFDGLRACYGLKAPAALGMLLSGSALAAGHDIQAVDAFTDVSSTGNVHTITSRQKSGTSAINVFDKFVVGSSHTVNLQVPDDASKLVNIVRGSEAPAVHGILNSYKNGSLGGDVVFASAAGFLVGPSGVVNVGSLDIKTPTESEINALTSDSSPVAAKVNDLLSDSYSVSSSGTVRIQGKINTASGLSVNANTIAVDSGGIVISGRAAQASAVSLAAVNVDDLTIPTELNVDGGVITLKASSSLEGAIDLAGDLYADGGFSIMAENIDVKAGATLDSQDSNSASTAGTIAFKGKTGQTTTTLSLSASGKTVLFESGTASTPEQSAEGITLIGNTTVAGTTTVSADTFKTKAGSSLDLSGSLTVTANSKADVSGTLAAESGITIASKDIDLNSGSTLDARNSGDSARGDVTLTASVTEKIGIGNATSETNIGLGGQIYAANVTATAKSIANSSFYEEPGTSMGVAATGALTGATFYFMDADADATVNVNSGANIQASGNVTLTSESHALTEASSISLGSQLTGSLAAVYATSDATSTTHVKSGATIEAGGDLEVSAHNESYISASAMDIIAEDTNKVVIAAAVGESDVDATAKIDSGVTLDASNLVLAAENQNYYYVSASAYGLKNTQYGVAVAIGDFDTNTTAELGSSLGSELDKTGNVTITSLNRTLNQRVHSGVTVGSSLLFRTVGSKVVQGVSALQTGVTNYTNQFLTGSGQSVEKDESGKVGFKGGLAFSLNLSDHDAYSYLGTNTSNQTDAPKINATGNVLVASQVDIGTDNEKIAGGYGTGSLGDDQGGYRTSAETAVTAPEEGSAGAGQTSAADASLALALNFAINDSDAVSEVGKFVQINAANLGVIAGQYMPIVSTYDKWDTIADALGKLNGIGGLQNNLLTTFANAGASADKEAYGGSLNVVWNDMDTKAWVGDSARVTTTGTGSWNASREVKANSKVTSILGDYSVFKDFNYNFSFDNSVEVSAYNLMETANLAGNIGSLGLLPNGNGTNKQGKAVGASITYVQQSGQAVGGIGQATVTATGDVDIYSETDERHILVTPSSGMGKGLGFNGALGFLNSEVLTHASLHKNAQLSAGDLVIVAEHEFGNWAAAGAVNWSTESAVGIAIAANVSQGDTKAFIGDNSSEYDKVKFQDSSNSNTTKPDPTSPTAPAPTKGIIANSVSVRGRSSGTNGSIAVAGALTKEPANEPGMGQKFENWYNGLSSKVAANYTGANSSNGDSSIGQSANNGANDDSNANNGQSSAEVSSAQTGLAGAGSFTVSVNNMDAKAIIDGASISGHSNGNGYNDVDVEVQALEKVISASASGSAALSVLGTQSPGNQNTIAGAIAYQISFNDALAWIKDTTISYADDVAVQALHGGELTSVALALSVTRPAGNSQMTRSGALSISGAQIYDGTSARIEGSSISSNNGADNDLEVSAYNNSYVGVGGGTLYGGGKQGAGLAITFAEINDPSAIVGDANPDGNNVLSSAYNEDVYDGKATEAVIDFSGSTRSTISSFDQIDVSARSLNRIGIGAAGVGYNDNQQDSLGFQGSFAIGSIGADTTALVKGVDISGATTVNVNATGEKDGGLDTIISNLGSSDTNKDFDFSGAEAMDNTNVHTAEDGSGSTYSYNSEGKRIIAVAGVVQVGKKNLGISYAHADVKSETKARIVDSNINKNEVNNDANTGATVNVNARDNSLLYSVAIGVGVGTGGFSGVGSVAVNRLNNQILAEIGDWDGSDKGTINASNVAVTAQNDMDMINVAGSVAVASGQGGASAGGLAVALNLVGTDEHSTRARVSNTNLKVDEDLTVKALSGASNDKNLLVGNAIAIGASLGQSGIGFAGAISTNNVDQTIQAAIKDTATNRSGDASSSSGGDILVKAQDYTDSVATAWMGAGSGNGSAGGVAIATNRVDSDVTAEVLGDGSAAGSTTLKAQNVVVDAFRRNWLLTIDAGVAASKQVSLAGSVGTGIIDGDVTARIAEDARIEAWNNVLVNADALSVNLVGSGAVGIGLDSGAGAVAISTAMEYGKTEAYIDDAVVIAKGKGSAMQVDTGDLQDYGDLPDLSTAGDDSDPDSVSMGDLTSGFDLLSVNRTKESVNGLVVNATSRTKQRAITVGGAGGKTVAINANVATNGTYNATKAYIKDSTINSGVTNESGADVYVRANAHEAGLAVSAGIAVSGGGEAAAAGVGGFATNAQKRSSEATVVNSTVNADKLTIDANSSKLAQAISAGVAAGLGTTGGLGGAASVVITEQMGDTRAWLRGGTTNANELVVVADRRQESNVAAGAAGIGTSVGVGIGLAVNIVGGDSQAIIGNDLDDNSDTYTTTVNSDRVTVDADRVSSVNSYTFGAGIGGGYGLAAMINTTEFRGETRAAVHGYLKSSDLTIDIRGSDGSSAATSVTVNAQEIQYANQMAAGIGAGASVGVGAVANVVLGRSQVYSEVVGSDVMVGTLDVDAAAQRESDLISVAGAASPNIAAAVSIGVALYGQGDTTAEDGTNAEDEFDPSRNEANTVLAADIASYNQHLSDDDIATLEADSGLTITRGSTPATSTTTESGKSLKLSGESVTAARISGGLVDVETLNVNSRTLQHSYQGLGAAQASSVGIAGVVGISRSYEMNIATVDSSVKASNAVIRASLENVSDDDGALEMKSFIVGLGGTSVVINYTDARSENRVVAGINSAVGDDNGDLQVTAKDSTEIRLGDVSSGKPSSVTDGSLNINIGAAAIGVSVGYAEKDGDIDAWIGEQGKLIDGYKNMALSAVNEGMVKSTGFALAGGLLAGVQGVITSAHDDSDVNATVYGEIGTGSGVVNVNARSAPSLYSSAYGVTVAAGGAMGGSFAYATTETKAQAEIADGAIFNGSGNVVVRSETGSGDDGYETAYAAAFAASGGMLAGIAGSEARATNRSQSIAKVGDGVSIPYSDFSVYARHTGVQIADADGYFVGLVAGGYQTGVAQSFTSTRVEFGKDPIAALERTGDLTLDANSFNQNQSFTTAGGGGYYAGSAAESVMDAGDYGSGKYSAAVLVDDWSSGYRVLPVDAGGVYISAASETEFFAGTDSTTVSVVGGSGATSKTEVDTNVRIDLGQNVSFSAMQVDIDAFNSAYQIQNPYFSGFSSSVYGAGGGAANGSAGLSYQNLKNLTAEVVLGKNGVLKISDLAWLDSTYDHNITIDANTDFYVYDESKLEIGGALQGAGAESDVDVKTRNKITVGEGYSIYNPVGEIGIGTHSRGSAVAQANVSVWAAAGVAGGVSDVYLDVLNQVNIGKNAVINSYGDVGIYSGRASNYFQENQLTSNALANVYNWTAIPIPAGNKARSNISLTNKVEFADGFSVGSDSHVFIEANEGALSSTHRGIEKNPYLELFSSETTFGSSDSSTSNVLTFNGSGSVVAGQYAYQWVEVDTNGSISSQLYRYGTAAQMDDKYSSRAELEAYIQELQDRIAELEAWTPDSGVVGIDVDDGNEDDAVGDPGAGDPGAPTGGGDDLVVDNSNPYQTEIDELKAEVVLLSAIVDDLSENPNFAIEVANVQATAGNVNLVADTITLAGSSKPTFTAKGDAYIQVENKTDEHLVLSNLSITNQTGGNVFVTGGASLPDTYIDEQSGSDYTDTTGITIDHAPSGTNYLDSDVIINGDISNLLSSVNISVAEGDLIQQAVIEANAINLDVKNGSLLLNSNKPQTYGRDPDALVNYTTRWKPASADDFVNFYINDKYSTAINAKGIDNFNNWFSGRAIRHTGDQISYYQNSSSCKSCDYGYDEMNIYFNWGFSDAAEYHGSDAIVFEMKTNSDSRGGSKWKFKPISNKQSSLTQSASYSEVKNTLGGTGTSIIGEKVVINAQRLDINGKIIVGTDNSWSVDVGSGFDATIAAYIRDAGLASGDTVSIVPGQTKWLRVTNPNYQPDFLKPDYDPIQFTWKEYNFDVSASAGSSGIGLTYDVATGNITADDIPVSGGGYVAIRARISSTGEDGNITVKDGLGQIDINNDSSSQLVLGTISAGDDATGIIRITDLNKRRNIDGDGRNYAVEYSEWFVHSPGSQIRQYETSAWAVSYDESNYVASHGGTGTTSSMTYNPVAGQIYYLREGATIKRSFDPPGDSSVPYDGKSIDGYFAKYPNTLGDWEYETNWNTETSYYTTCTYKPEACSGGTASNYLTQTYDYGSASVWRVNWWLSYDKYYGSNMTNVDPLVEVAYRLSMDTHTYVKADNAIKFQFTGLANGSIDLTSKGNIELTGNVYNPSGTTNISTQNNLITAGSTAITSDVTTISAKGSIGSLENPLSVITDELGISSSHGSLYFNVTGTDGDVELQHLKAKYDIIGVIDKGVVAKNSSTIIQADQLDLTSLTGGIGKVGTIGNTSSYQFINISTTGAVKLNAATDIAVNQASGDLELYSAIASEEVVIKLGNGRLKNAIGRLDKTDEELAYDAAVWDSLHLLDDDAGAVTVSSYENQFTHKYHTYWMLKQRLTDTSDQGFAIDPAYLEALKLRYNETDEAALTSLVKSDYQGLEQWFADQVATPENFVNPEDAKGVEQKGILYGYDYVNLFSGDYDQDYKLSLAQDSSWYTDMVDGAQWKQSQLDISISSTALNGDASSQLSNRNANVTASDVHFMVNSGGVGENLDDLVFTVNTTGSGNVSDAQKAALLAAGAGDISTEVSDSSVTFRVKQVDPIKVDVPGELYASASDEIYIESTSGLTVGQLNSSGDDVRLIVDGAIGSKSGLTNILGRDLYISNTRGDIGASGNALKLDLSGALRQAGAASDMYLHHVNGVLKLGSVSAGGLLSIYNNNDLLAYNDESFISADTFVLDVDSHDIGASSNALDVIMTGTGGLQMDADNAWLNVRDTSLFTLDNTEVDNQFTLTSAGALDLQGNIKAKGLKLDVSGDISSGNGLTINVTNHTDLDAAGIDLEGVTVQTGTASLYAQSGSLTLSDITTTSGLMSLLANGQMNLNGGVRTQTGNLIMDANRLVMDSQATINSAGDITATASDSMALFNLTANSGKVKLTTANNQNASLGAIALTGLAAREAEITSQASITAGQIDIENTAVLNSGTFTAVNSVVTSEGNFSISASDDISINGPLTSEQGSIIIRGQKDLFVNRRLDASREVDVDIVGTLTLDAEQTIASDQKTTLKAASLQMNQGSLLDIEGDLKLATSGDQVLARLDVEGSLDADSSTGSIRFNERSDMAMAADILAAGNVTIAEQQTLSTGSGLKVESTALDMLAGSTLDTGTTLNLINDTMSMGDGALLKAAQDIQTQTSGSATFHQIESLQAVDLSAGDALTVNSTIDAGTALIIDADGTLTLHKAVATKDNIVIDAVDVATMNGLVTSAEGTFQFRGDSHLKINNTVSTKGSFTVTDAKTVSVATGKDIISESIVAINAASIQMGAGSKLEALSALTLTTTGNQKLAMLDAGGDLKVESSTGWVAFDETVTTKGAADIDVSGSLTLADEQGFNSTLGADINASSVNFGDNSILNVDGSLNLSTVGQAELYTVDVEGSAALTNGGNLAINDRLDVVDNLTLDVGGDATFNGAVLVENALLADDIDGKLTVIDTLTAENDINITAGKDVQFNGVLTSKAGLLDIQGSGALTFNDDVSINDSINLVIANGVSLAGGKAITSGGNTSIQSASVTMGDTARFDTGSDLIINTVSHQELATLGVDGNLDIDSANGSVELKEHVTVMNAVTIDVLNGAVTLAENQQLYSGSDTTIHAESLTFANGSVLDVDGALDVSTKADVELFNVDVANGTQFTNGGSLTTNSGVLIGDNLILDVAGDATFNKAVNVGNALLADDIDGKLTAIDTLTIENDINITAGKDVQFNGVLTSKAGLLDIQGSGTLTFNDDASINDSINLVIANGVSLAGGKAITSGGNTSIQSASVTMGDTARFDTDSDLIINTVSHQELATLGVDGNLDIDSVNGGVELKEHVTVMNAVTIDALNGAVTLAENQQLYSGSDTTIHAESLTFANGSVLDVDGALDVSTKADVELFNVDVANGTQFTNGGSLTTNSGVLIGDNLILDVAGDATFNKAVNVGNALLADDIDGKLTVIDTLTIENDINITAGKDVQFNGVLTSKAGLLDIQGSGALTFNDDVSINDSINLVIANGVSLAGGKAITSGGNTSIQSASVTMGDTARFDIGVDLTIDTSGNQELATLNVGGSLDVDSSAGTVDFKEHVSVLGNTDLLVENAITLADDQKIESTGWIRAESDTFTMGDRSIIKSGGSTSLFTDGDQELATLDIGDDFTATSQQGTIHFNESVTVANDMNLLAAREITLAAQQAINAGSMAIGSETLLGADSFAMGEDSVIHTRELTLVHTRGDQLIGQLLSDAADSAFYLKTTEGSINGRADLDIAGGERHLKATQRVGCDAEGKNCTGAQGQLMAATGIGDPLVIDLPWLSAETDNGDINILASSDLYARLLKATNGNIYMTVLGYLEIDELIGTPWLMVNDFLFADRMNLDRGGLASRESVVVNQINMTDGGPLAVYAPEIDLTIDGGDAAETLMAMGGFNETLSLTSDARSYYQNLEVASFKPGSFANNVRVDINNTAQLHITDLLTQGGDLRMTGNLLMDAATVNTGQGYNLRLVTGYQSGNELSMDLNNTNGSSLPVDGQFMTPFGEFWMSVEDVNVTTNAQFTRYNLPLLLTYKGSLDDPSAVGLPESFYRLSLEYQNEITSQALSQRDEGTSILENAGEQEELVAVSDDWLSNLPATATGEGEFVDGDLPAGQSEEEEEYWLIGEPGVEKES